MVEDDSSTIPAFDVLFNALKWDVHKDNEWLLRHAAKYGQLNLARHLVKTHDADLSNAITIAHTLGQDMVGRDLDRIWREMYPEEHLPPTIERLSSAVSTLQAQVQEMQKELAALRSPREWQLDKPALKPPHGPN